MDAEDQLIFEGYSIDRSRWILRWRDEAIALSRKTFDVLLYLIDHRDRVVGMPYSAQWLPIIVLSAMFFGVLAHSEGAPPEPDLAALVAQASYPLSFTNGRLSGAGQAHLLHELASAQFVLLGESHYDHDTPLFAQALYRDLNGKLGFHHLVVEQDPIAIEDALKAGARGNASAIAEIAKRDPYLFGFASDQDLQLLADVGRLDQGPDTIWGLEQAQGTTRYLKELIDLAGTPALRAECARLLDDARKIEMDRGPHGDYLSEPDAYAQMQTLRTHFTPAAGSRAEKLLDGLVISAEIYSYYRRAEAGEYVGFFNNTVRESLFKREFVADYTHAVAHGEALPKAMFKFGDVHMFHGLDPVMAFPIGNFAHEFAISHGLNAYGIDILPLGAYAQWSDLPAWLLPLLPASAPNREVLIDLRALRPYQRLFRAKVADKDQWEFRAFINGYDALLLLPNSRKADMTLTGFANPF
jgi:hypothetical protein